MPQGKSSDLAAAAVGWFGEQYLQAKRVTKDADDETKAKVDAGEMSVNKAYQKVTGKRRRLATHPAGARIGRRHYGRPAAGGADAEGRHAANSRGVGGAEGVAWIKPHIRQFPWACRAFRLAYLRAFSAMIDCTHG